MARQRGKTITARQARRRVLDLTVEGGIGTECSHRLFFSRIVAATDARCATKAIVTRDLLGTVNVGASQVGHLPLMESLSKSHPQPPEFRKYDIFEIVLLLLTRAAWLFPCRGSRTGRHSAKKSKVWARIHVPTNPLILRSLALQPPGHRCG